jgi:hypothetical protein
VNVADYLAKVYPPPPCWELVTDVYTTELGENVDAYQTISGHVRSIASTFRLVLHKSAHGFAQLAEPVDFAVVLMGRTPKLGLHHAGIYYQGSVLHALEGVTVYQDLASLRDQYQLLQFWAK